MLTKLLPHNSTPWEKSVAGALDTVASVTDSINAIRGTKLTNPPSSFLPFLVYEYGLDELRPYVPNLYNLINQGIAWQRIRGTLAAVLMGLGFIGYTASIEEALTRRRFWNSFQLRFPSLPANDAPDLDEIDGIATLSVPERSVFRRGVHYYDATALEADELRTDGALLDTESGVRLRENGPLWSFGTPTDVDHLYLQAEGELLGNWTGELASLAWEDMTFPWTAATFAWDADPAVARKIGLASWFVGKVVYVALRDGDGLIGYRRARAVHQVSSSLEGVYSALAQRWSPDVGGTRVYISALTGFGDGQGRTATAASLAFNVGLAADVPPGKLWLFPAEVVSADEIANTAVNLPLRPTVRQDVKFLLRF